MSKDLAIQAISKGLSDIWNTPVSISEVSAELLLIEIGRNPSNKVLSKAIKKLLK